MLQITDVIKKYKGFTLGPVRLDLEPGYVLGLIGPNGAGKTTLIKLILGLVRPDSGGIRVFGLDACREGKEVRRRIGFVHDENHIFDDLNIGQIRRIAAPLYPGWDSGRYESLIDRFGLPEGKKIRNFSKGMKTKFALALALAHGAELVLLDEPTSGLDPVVRSEILGLISETLESGNVSVVYSTHITSDLDKIADYVTFLDDGKIVFSESRNDIIDGHYICKGGLDDLKNGSRPRFIKVRRNEYGFQGLVKGAENLPQGFTVERPNLEEIMLFYVKGE